MAIRCIAINDARVRDNFLAQSSNSGLDKLQQSAFTNPLNSDDVKRMSDLAAMIVRAGEQTKDIRFDSLVYRAETVIPKRLRILTPLRHCRLTRTLR